MKKLLSAILMLAVCSTNIFAQCTAVSYQSYSFCGSGSVTVNGHTHSATSTTTYRDTLPGAAQLGCDSIIVSIIGVSTVPASPAPVNSFTVANGDVVNAVNFSLGSDTSVYASWRSSNASVGLTAGGAGNLPSFTAINNGSIPLIDTITVSARFRGYAYLAADTVIIKWSLTLHQFVDTIHLPSGGNGAIQVVESPAGNVAYILCYATGGAYKTIYVLDLATDQIIRALNYS